MSNVSHDTSVVPPKILIIGGTTEGRIAVQTCDEANKPYYYSTKSDSQKIDCVHGIRISGGFDAVEMTDFCRRNDIGLIIDAAHPFAMNVHRNIGLTANVCDIPVVRIERKFPERNDQMHWFDTYTEAISYMEKQGITRLLALTGVNTIKALKDFWQRHEETYFRIMKRPESLEEVDKASFPRERILFYDETRDDRSLFQRIRPQAIITKESGDAGGFTDKTDVALEMGIPVLVIRRPALPYPPHSIVYGKYGLRRSIEEILPFFYDLKIGYTTGSCATAATTAAMTTLLTGKILGECSISLPNDEPITIPIETTDIPSEGKVTCVVKKYSGDDPDVTNGTTICSTVALNDTHSDIRFLQGKGVGVVTLPGLGLKIGEPAINPTPRMMMMREITRLRHLYCEDTSIGVDIIISVPAGAELAKRTFNPKIGIIGGISIIGTSGIVKPFSSEAFVNSIKAEIRVAKSMGLDRLVINSGAKSEKYLRALYPDLPSQGFVHYGNFIGETVKAAAEEGFKYLTMGVMIGKAVKLAEGNLDTHSKKVVMNKDFIRSLAEEAGCTSNEIEAISKITLAREIWEIIPKYRTKDPQTTTPFYTLLAYKCYEVCAPLIPEGTITIFLITESGELIH